MIVSLIVCPSTISRTDVFFGHHNRFGLCGGVFGAYRFLGTGLYRGPITEAVAQVLLCGEFSRGDN
jgi:hypothetical protein